MDFFRAVYAYIESGIPMVAAMTQKEHAVTLIGHGKIDNQALQASNDTVIYVADYLEEFIISNDNELPFTTIAKENHLYTFVDLDYVVVPLYEKMYLNANIVHKRVEGLISSQILEFQENIVLRVYLTSVRSLKREILKDSLMDETLKSIILKLHTPQFVWCADMYTKDEYSKQLTSAKIIIDSTAGTYEDDPWLLMHDGKKLIFRDEYEIKRIDMEIDPYTIVHK